MRAMPLLRAAALAIVAAAFSGCSVLTDWEIRPLVVSGVLRGADGAPIPGVQVTMVEPFHEDEFERVAAEAKRGEFTPAASKRASGTVSDAAGRFRARFAPILRRGEVWVVPPICVACDRDTYLILHVHTEPPATFSFRIDKDDGVKTRTLAPAEGGWRASSAATLLPKQTDRRRLLEISIEAP